MNSSLPATPIDFEAIVSAALSKQAQLLEQEQNESLQRQAAHFEKIVSDLQEKFSSLSSHIQHVVTNPNKPQTSSAVPSVHKKVLKTPIRVTRAVSAPPVTMKKSVVSSLKATKKAAQASWGTPMQPIKRRHPAQLISSEIPSDFARFKVSHLFVHVLLLYHQLILLYQDALFLHIRMLWGLFEQTAVPAKVNPILAQEFYNRFSTVPEIEQAVSDPGAPNLIAQDDIINLRQGQAGCFKLGRELANMEEMHILYVHALLVKVGIRIWGPNLEETPDSLFNSACRITALNLFRQLAASGAYQYMNINPAGINEVSLLVSAYNHYVHYLMETQFKKELKQVGTHARDHAKKSIQKNQERVSQCKTFNR
jgi:hypothetical protein